MLYCRDAAPMSLFRDVSPTPLDPQTGALEGRSPRGEAEQLPHAYYQ